MNKKILIGSIISVILLVLMSFSPSITADISKPDIDVVEEDVTPTPIVLVLQLITKLRNHKDIQNVETEDDVLQIIESDEELNSIFEQLSQSNNEEDCGCEDDYKPELEGRRWFIVCTILIPIWFFSVLITWGTGESFLEDIVYPITEIFNCNFE